jgi:amino acid permease
MIACLFECTCAIKLSQCGNFTKKISYTEIVLHALGPRFCLVFQVMIALVQFQFTISQLAFVIESIDSTFNDGIKHEISSSRGKFAHFYISFIIICIFAPLTWVRRIQRFRFAFIFGVSMILLAVCTISIYCFDILSDRDFIKPPGGYFAINNDRYWDMIGFSFFMFEGIGSVMPIMNACN